MAKKAFLVEFNVRTRVVADVEDDTLEDLDDFHKVVITARERIMINGPAGYFVGDNVYEAELDTEVPYDPEMDDKIK